MEQVGFIKFVNPSITFQTAVRSRIELALCSILLTPEEKKPFSRSNDEKKKKATTELYFDEIPTNQHQVSSECEPNYLPAFDISIEK